MVNTLVTHGNSYALVIGKPIFAMLGITPDTPLEITTTDGMSLRVAAAVDRASRVADATAWMNETYAVKFMTLTG